MVRLSGLFRPQWTTPNGKRPIDPSSNSVPASHAIVTPVIFKLDGAPLTNTLSADVTSGEIVAATFGGQVDTDVVRLVESSLVHNEAAELIQAVGRKLDEMGGQIRRSCG